MTRTLALQGTDRLMVFAPHPDDETLAAGELIQLAVAAGASVRVVFATDGDNNPWPQRWAEKRFAIGPDERARWGALRRHEALAALAALGVGEGAARFLGWPDQGLTERLMGDSAAIDELAAEILAFAPTHVVLPSLRDRHPDHGALRVMLDLALARAEHRCVRLGYVVHGRETSGSGWQLSPDRARHARKRAALGAHASQMTLSRRRLLRWAAQAETFELAEPDSATLHAPSTTLRIALPPPHRLVRQHELLLIWDERHRLHRARIVLPRAVRRDRREPLGRVADGRVAAEIADGALYIAFLGGEPLPRGYAKLDRTWPRLVIFDADIWSRLDGFTAGPESMPIAMHQVPHRAST